MAFLLASSLIREVEYDRPSLIPFTFENFFLSCCHNILHVSTILTCRVYYLDDVAN